MNSKPPIVIFGEVLFDCFPGGECVLGGAPFNVAWHLQAMGDTPLMVSRVGSDELGEQILHAMRNWGMDTRYMQRDPTHPTGTVAVEMTEGEPHYNIVEPAAYDYIDAGAVSRLSTDSILYHGTLGLRGEVSRAAFRQLTQGVGLSTFIDVNLRAPYWQQDEVYEFLHQARWAKLNQDELRLLGFAQADLAEAISRFQSQFQLEHVVLTQGEKGALISTENGLLHSIKPEPAKQFVDTVGAGDAFTAVYLHGLVSGWSLADTLERAQGFASKVVGIRGATSSDPAFYQDYGGR